MAIPFAIGTIQELQHLLNLQRSMTRQASLELDDIVKGVLQGSAASAPDYEEYLATVTMEREFDLLEQYALLPTLTEHDRNPALRSAMKPGATFAVAAIVAEVILAHLRAMAEAFPKAHRMLLMVMLHEFDKPVSDDIDLVDTFMRSMTVDLHESIGPVSMAEKRRLLRSMLQPLAEAMVLVAHQFRLIESHRDEGWILTHVGERVLVHLYDAQRFLDSVADAHRRFQLQTRMP